MGESYLVFLLYVNATPSNTGSDHTFNFGRNRWPRQARIRTAFALKCDPHLPIRPPLEIKRARRFLVPGQVRFQ